MTTTTTTTPLAATPLAAMALQLLQLTSQLDALDRAGQAGTETMAATIAETIDLAGSLAETPARSAEEVRAAALAVRYLQGALAHDRDGIIADSVSVLTEKLIDEVIMLLGAMAGADT